MRLCRLWVQHGDSRVELDRLFDLLEVSQARFDSAPEGLEGALEGLSDLAALKRLTRLATTAATADELLQAAVEEARAEGEGQAPSGQSPRPVRRLPMREDHRKGQGTRLP